MTRYEVVYIVDCFPCALVCPNEPLVCFLRSGVARQDENFIDFSETVKNFSIVLKDTVDLGSELRVKVQTAQITFWRVRLGTIFVVKVEESTILLLNNIPRTMESLDVPV